VSESGGMMDAVFGGIGFAAREAQGSVWLGALSEAQFGSIALSVAF